MKTVLEKTDRNSSTPSGLVRLDSAYVNRLHRMLFMLIPLRGFMKGVKGSQIAQEIVLALDYEREKRF
ncbi:MAG: hypothetical protein L6422_10330 [Candidatus Marinimicrobia bacterium]|nr:hypothetical protein [Candidatus Neomarinimicrobiota bacterium]